MNKKYIIAIVIIIVFIAVGLSAFLDSKIEYADFIKAKETQKTCQVKGVWLKGKETKYNSSTNQLTFYMLDENNTEMKVVFDGPQPNNFEIAEHVVVKGKVMDGHFHAKDILTKCPSKYEGQGEDVKKPKL